MRESFLIRASIGSVTRARERGTALSTVPESLARTAESPKYRLVPTIRALASRFQRQLHVVKLPAGEAFCPTEPLGPSAVLTEASAARHRSPRPGNFVAGATVHAGVLTIHVFWRPRTC